MADPPPDLTGCSWTHLPAPPPPMQGVDLHQCWVWAGEVLGCGMPPLQGEVSEMLRCGVTGAGVQEACVWEQLPGVECRAQGSRCGGA